MLFKKSSHVWRAIFLTHMNDFDNFSKNLTQEISSEFPASPDSIFDIGTI